MLILNQISYFPTHHSLFKPVVKYLRSLFFDKIKIKFFHYKIENNNLITVEMIKSIKLIGIGFNKDKGFILDSLFMKGSGYMSCTQCLEIGFIYFFLN